MSLRGGKSIMRMSGACCSFVLILLSLPITICRCDFRSIALNDFSSEAEGKSPFGGELDAQVPLIMKGLLGDWPDSTDFMDRYGNLTIQIGSESSIVQSQGSADSLLKLKDLYNTSKDFRSESVTFDLDVLRKHPRLLSSYAVPALLESRFSHEALSSPVLSIGFVHSGNLLALL